MSPQAPSVAVVVATFNRAALLPDLIGALEGQTVADFEAVLVDDGSSDGTYAELQRLTGGDDRFRLIRKEGNQGQAAARNLGWRATTAPWVAFTDDDCAPRPDWLAGLLAASRTADVVQGRTVPAASRPHERPGWFDRTQRIERWSGRYETCNLLHSRAVLERHEGFREDVFTPPVMGEDTDLGLRATSTGAVATFAPDAVVEHQVFPSGFRDYLAQRRRYAEIVKLMAVNPAARTLLVGRVILRGVHVLIWGLPPLAVTSVAAGVAWLPVAVVGGWVLLNAHRTRHRPFSPLRRVGYSVLHLVAYAYEAACFAAASVRYRSFVL
jgi:GT2 family glycosyltransferase